MRKYFYILFVITLSLQAQQYSQYSLPSQIDRNLLYLNPAYAGYHEATVASVMHRSQWVNWPGALSIQNFEFHTPLKMQTMALGVEARHESIGLKNNTEAFLTYAYRLRFDRSTLAFALKAGVQSIAFSDAQITNQDDPSFIENSSLIPNGGFGMSFYTSDYFVGLSVPYFFGSVSSGDGSQQLDFNMDRMAFNLSAGGNIDINDDIAIQPSGSFVYYMSWPMQFLGVVNFQWREMFTLGAGYRHQEAILINAGYSLNRQLSIAYTYDYNIGLIGPYTSGSHQIGLLYYFGYKVNTINPRDF